MTMMLRHVAVVGFFAALLSGCGPKTLCLNCIDGGGITVDDGGQMIGDGGIAGDGGGGDGGGANPDLSDCDPTKLDSDPNHCGACGNACPRAHSVPTCVQGLCEVSCDVGWVDLDGVLANDCEYECLATGAEICDEIDNDCNGVPDDVFDKLVDPNNCGTCGTTCTFTNGVGTCMGGMCELSGCAPGFRDRDSLIDGCEYQCPVYPSLTFEICNGIDDDCDGDIDEPVDLETPPASLCITAMGTPCQGTLSVCEDRNGITTWYCDYSPDVEADRSLPNGITSEETLCDGKDGDCDSNADDPFTTLGVECDNGLLGACRDIGVFICDVAQPTQTRCDLSVAPDPTPGAPLTEQCNGLDDDCDGFPDNTTGALRLVQDMVHVQEGMMNFYIDRFEASRPDATDVSAGVDGARSCSKADALPWTRVTYASALAACTSAGLRLCTAAEWQMACAGAAARVYPYGNAYLGATCNGIDFAAVASVLPTGDASLAMCSSASGVRDLSGNVKEWTNDQQGSTGGVPIYVVRGGAYISPELGLTCGTTFSQASANTSLSDIGFRCCSTNPP